MKKKNIIGLPTYLGGSGPGTEKVIEELMKFLPDLSSKIQVIPPKDRSSFNEFFPKINHISFLSNYTKDIMDSLKETSTPLAFLGGDHSISIPSIGHSLDICPREKLGVIWIDAHADINTSMTSPSKNLHGMVTSTLLGFNSDFPSGILPTTLPFNNLVLFGVRDLDPGELHFIKKHHITIITDEDIKRDGLESSLDRVKKALKVEKLHISFDFDVLDPNVFDHVLVPASGGITFEDLHKTFDFLKDEFDILGLDIVEYFPKGDKEMVGYNFIDTLLKKLSFI